MVIGLQSKRHYVRVHFKTEAQQRNNDSTSTWAAFVISDVNGLNCKIIAETFLCCEIRTFSDRKSKTFSCNGCNGTDLLTPYPFRDLSSLKSSEKQMFCVSLLC